MQQGEAYFVQKPPSWQSDVFLVTLPRPSSCTSPSGPCKKNQLGSMRSQLLGTQLDICRVQEDSTVHMLPCRPTWLTGYQNLQDIP